MSVALEGADDKFAAEHHGQLATPALSPISEHDYIQAIPHGSPELERRRSSLIAEQLPRRRSSETRTLKLSPKQIINLTTSPESLPLEPIDDGNLESATRSNSIPTGQPSDLRAEPLSLLSNQPSSNPPVPSEDNAQALQSPGLPRPQVTNRRSSTRTSKPRPQLSHLRTDEQALTSGVDGVSSHEWHASPAPAILPLPPPSLPTYLHLELASERPSALYVHRSASADFPYESSQVKFERLLNFLLLPPNLEQVLWFGALACLDAWLYTFTILPLRFAKAVAILIRWWVANALHEVIDLGTFVYRGLGRIRDRRRNPPVSRGRQSSRPDGSTSRRSSDHVINTMKQTSSEQVVPPPLARQQRKNSSVFRHKRTRSTPSILLANHKADLLQGMLIIASCVVLMSFDASRMYHSIRGQAAIKLYVIYNVLEVFDRLFSALGQDVLECLFSKETLERNTDGRSKIFRPLWMFALALVYNVIHATALFYQVVTLNVAVNSYSNALLTLLMSNQFVEIKGSVFKKFEKENLFQLTCADIVERFQLWLMLLIIALRNIVEVGGLSISLQSAFDTNAAAADTMMANHTTTLSFMPRHIIPKAFTLLPTWTGEVFGPFLIVLGSEALVDWCKHAYITKFNNVKPNIYGRFLDLLAKDYYTHAFSAADGHAMHHHQNLTKRLGLPVLPLACLFIRACMQTYHMFLATHVPLPMPPSITSLAEQQHQEPTATTATLRRLDEVFRRALGRSTFGVGAGDTPSVGGAGAALWTFDDTIALATMVIFFLAIYFVLLALKLVLGMSLLTFARNRYRDMKEREQRGANGSVDAVGSRRVGGWGVIEVGEEKRRWVYDDDPEGLEQLREKEARSKQKAEKDMKLDKVERYTMSAKRIW